MTRAAGTRRLTIEDGLASAPAPLSTAAPVPRPRVVAVPDLYALSQLGDPWQTLARDPIEAAICSEPAWLSSGLEHLADGGKPPAIVSIWDRGSAGERLVGLAAFERTRWRWGVPLAAAVNWAHPHVMLGLPLIDRGCAVEALGTLITAGLAEGPLPLLFQRVPLDGPFMDALAAACAETGARLAITSSHERAAYRCRGDFDAYLQETFPRKRRKEFRRLRARLGECGRLEFKRFGPGDDVEAWLNSFEALEDSGWKGRGGTALARDSRSSHFFHQALSRLAGEDRLRFWALALDDRPLAMLFAVTSGRQAWLGKIAYDESFARYSPGVLLILEATAEMEEGGDIGLIDSSAVPDHPMIDHLWRDRIAIGDVLVGPPGLPGWAFDALSSLERTRMKGRARLKSLIHTLFRRP